MNIPADEIREGITRINGKISRNLMFEPMVSHTYFLEDEDEVIIFDPSCGKVIAKRIEEHIKKRLNARAKWKRAIVVAGHSHLDHANNFYLSEVTRTPDAHIYVHEKGFQDGKVKNRPIPFIENMVDESKKYYNIYLSYPFPYNLLMYSFAGLDALSPVFTRKIFALAGSVPWAAPSDGSVEPEPLRNNNMQDIQLAYSEIKGWRVGNKIIFPTPGHSSCSVSLLWQEHKALFISDADWIGNPVFASVSLRDSIASLKKLRVLSESENIELLLPAHGQVKEGVENIMNYLDFHIKRLEVLRQEVLTTYYSCGELKDVCKLTKVLTQQSPNFRMLKLVTFPRLVVFIHNIVAVSLREEGILK